MKWTRSHKRWCNRRAPITCEMQSTPICENKATRGRGCRRRNDAFSSPSALFQGYYRSNGWIYGVLMCHDSVNHVFFQFPLCCLMKQVGGKIFIKLKEQAVKWATGASRGKHQDSSGSKSVESVEYENALNAKKIRPYLKGIYSFIFQMPFPHSENCWYWCYL